MAAPRKAVKPPTPLFVPKNHIILQKGDAFWALAPKTGREKAISIPAYLSASLRPNGPFYSKTIWSPDASQVLFTESYSEPRYATESLWLADLKTGTRLKIPSKNSVLNFQFTPNGSKVVLLSEDVYTGEYNNRNLAVYDIKAKKFTLKKNDIVDFSLRSQCIIRSVS